MSYILDALNKSEQERREQQHAPSLQAIHQGNAPQPTHKRRQIWLFMCVALLCAAMLVAAIYVYQKTADHGPASSAPPVAATAPMAPTQPMVPAQVMTANPTQTPPPASAANVTSLYNQPEPELPPVEPKTIESASALTLSAAELDMARAALSSISTTPSIHSLPPGVKNRLPELYYSAHIFSNEEGKGFVIINDQSRYKGDVIARGLYVQEVLEEGVILNFEGTAFFLDALTDWPE